ASLPDDAIDAGDARDEASHYVGARDASLASDAGEGLDTSFDGWPPPWDGGPTCNLPALGGDHVTAIAPVTGGGTRLRPRYAVLDDGDTKLLFDARDLELGTSCSVRKASDGVMRCVPSPLSEMTYYADAQCTKRLDVVVVAPGCATPKYAVVAGEYRTVGP